METQNNINENNRISTQWQSMIKVRREIPTLLSKKVGKKAVILRLVQMSNTVKILNKIYLIIAILESKKAK